MALTIKKIKKKMHTILWSYIVYFDVINMLKTCDSLYTAKAILTNKK